MMIEHICFRSRLIQLDKHIEILNLDIVLDHSGEYFDIFYWQYAKIDNLDICNDAQKYSIQFRSRIRLFLHKQIRSILEVEGNHKFYFMKKIFFLGYKKYSFRHSNVENVDTHNFKSKNYRTDLLNNLEYNFAHSRLYLIHKLNKYYL